MRRKKEVRKGEREGGRKEVRKEGRKKLGFRWVQSSKKR